MMYRLMMAILFLLPVSVSYADSFAANTGGGTLTSKFTMNLKSSCSASVGDAAFGNQTGAQLNAGIAAKNITITITCDAILANYTIKLTPNLGVNDAATGTMLSSNNFVAYQLRWVGNQFGTANSFVKYNTVLSVVTKPTTTSFTIPISVQPVKRGTTASVAGAANASLSIAIAFI